MENAPILGFPANSGMQRYQKHRADYRKGSIKSVTVSLLNNHSNSQISKGKDLQGEFNSCVALGDGGYLLDSLTCDTSLLLTQCLGQECLYSKGPARQPNILDIFVSGLPGIVTARAKSKVDFTARLAFSQDGNSRNCQSPCPLECYRCAPLMREPYLQRLRQMLHQGSRRWDQTFVEIV